MEVKTTTTITVHIQFEDSERPQCKPWYGASRPAAWSSVTAVAGLPVVLDDVRVTARGVYVRADGTPGRASAEMRFGRLSEMPDGVYMLILQALGAAS